MSEIKTMVNIFYTNILYELPKQLWDKYIKSLPEDMIIRNSRYRRWQDRHSHLLGILLLLEGFKKYDISFEMLGYLKYNEFNRPYLNGNIDFNISHSGKFVICSIGENVRLGIDIEECRDINFSEFEKVMTNEQWEIINGSSNPLKTFFKFWTSKESVIKAVGQGLSIPLLDINVVNDKVYYDNHTWYLNEINLNDNYCACLASNKPNITINLLEVDYY
jgi:4'-phosphopantetheinyl transferase